jgi:uncharacterized protein (TIGR02265 family)
MKAVVKGFLLTGLVDIVKQQKPRNGVELLKKYYSEPLKFDGLKDYPYEMAEKLRDAVAMALYAEVNNQSIEKIGGLVWQLISGSLFGKTLIRFFGTNFKEIAEQAPRFYELIAPMGQYSYTDLGEKAFRLSYINELSPPAFHVGINKAAAAKYGLKPKITVEHKGKNTYDLKVEWG